MSTLDASGVVLEDQEEVKTKENLLESSEILFPSFKQTTKRTIIPSLPLPWVQ